jgi:CheY-like chemotaxis protein
MGGSIDMVSDVGAGTTMILDLPLPIADPALLEPFEPKAFAALPSAPAPLSPEDEGLLQADAGASLVLVVDDHPTNRMLLMSQVGALGYAAESAVNGAEAFRLWKSGRFALVLTDCNMPEMTGYELARAIRAAEPAAGERCPILACTANAMSDEVLHCIEAGMDAYLVKPMDLNSLAAELKRWLPMPGSLQPGLA